VGLGSFTLMLHLIRMVLLTPAQAGSGSRESLRPRPALPPSAYSDLLPSRDHLKGEESRCHGTRVLTWAGRAVPYARVTDTAQSVGMASIAVTSTNVRTSNGRRPW
jgi:hypothetical protein